jgi:hypothetical protein
MSIIKQIRNIAALGLTSIVMALPISGCKSIPEPVSVTEYSHPVSDINGHAINIYPSNYPRNDEYDEKRTSRRQALDLEGFISSGFGSDPINRKEFVTNGGAVNDYFFAVNKKNNAIVGDVLSAEIATDFSIKEGKTIETDLSLKYSVPTDIMKNLSGGYSDETYGDRVSFAVDHWNYNGKRENQNMFSLGWFHNSRADLDFNYDFPMENPVSSGLLSFTFSKKFVIGELGKTKISIAPNGNLSYLYNWEGMNGFPEFSPGIILCAERRGVVGSVGFKHQVPLLNEIKDKNYFFGEIGLRF